MTKRAASTWRIIGIVAAIALSLYMVGYFLVLPRFTTWMKARFPEAFALQETLQAQYPDRKIGFADKTTYGPSTAHGKERILVIDVAGRNHLESDKLNAIQSTICSELDQNSQKYHRIVLQSTIEHRFLIFYSRKSESTSFDCRQETGGLNSLD